MIYNEIIQGNDFSKNLISFESEKYILFDCEIYSEFLYLHKRLRNTEYINRIRDRKIAIKIRWNKNRMKWTFSPSRAQSRTQFELCHGEKTTVENKRTISLSRVQSSLLELPRREMEHENEGIIEAFRGGAAAHDCLSEQDRTPLRNAGRIGPATSETMGYSVWKDYIFLAFDIVQ